MEDSNVVTIAAVAGKCHSRGDHVLMVLETAVDGVRAMGPPLYFTLQPSLTMEAGVVPNGADTMVWQALIVCLLIGGHTPVIADILLLKWSRGVSSSSYSRSKNFIDDGIAAIYATTGRQANRVWMPTSNSSVLVANISSRSRCATQFFILVEVIAALYTVRWSMRSITVDPRRMVVVIIKSALSSSCSSHAIEDGVAAKQVAEIGWQGRNACLLQGKH